MFCENCGNKLKEGHQFCTECGYSTVSDMLKKPVANHPLTTNERWWHRLLKVLYIIAHLPLLIIIPIVWSSNSSNYYTGADTSGTAFWYSILTLLIYMAIVRLIKIAVLYVSAGRKPEWKKEFKKLF